MGATQVLSLSNVRRIVGVSGKQYKKIVWHTSEIIVKPMLSISEYVQTVRKILNACRGPEDSIALELIDFAIRSNIISAYSFVQMPEDIDELYYIVYVSDLYDKICSVANKDQIESIKKSVMLYVGG